MSDPPQVLNKHWSKPLPNSVYIGRPSKWGNPFSHKDDTKAKYKVKTRDEAVEAFEKLINKLMENNPQLREDIIRELGGKNLVCWCAPARCHGDALLKIANPTLGERSESADTRIPTTEPDVASSSSASERVRSREASVQQTDGSRVPCVDRRAVEV